MILLLPCAFSTSSSAQCGASLNGYVSDMQQVMFEEISGKWTIDNNLHNRLNFKTFIGENLNFTIELRNRFFFGETVRNYPGYSESLDKDMGWIDLNRNIAADSSFILNSAIDRIYLDFSVGKLQITAGRQRINWGVNFVWNPNDIFNSYSYFDFDYVERPGSDALRLQYYPGSTTRLELACKLNHEEKYSLAGLVSFNLSGYDFQFLGGIIDQDEFVIGTGFSGNIGPVSINGELSYLDPVNDNDPRRSALITGAGAGYNTPFNLFIQAEYLYNQAAETISLSGFNDFYYRNISLRDLSFSPHTFFAGISYPLSPVISAGLASMWFPEISGYFAGPTIDLSLRDDFDLSLIIQHFRGNLGQNTSSQATLGFLRFKWSF